MGGEGRHRLGSLSKGALDHFIYIIGSARGGTSVLFDAIGLHDQILALPGMTHFMNQVWRYRNTVHMRLLRQVFRLPGFYDEAEVVGNLDKMSGIELKRYIDKAMNSRDLKKMWQIYPVVYALDKKNQKDPSRITGWADKANDFFGVGRVAKAFPNGKFVFIVRDPRGAVSSLAKRMAVKKEFTFEAGIDDGKVIEAAISWSRMTQRLLHFIKAHPERSILIRLEEFLSNPVVSLNGIFQFTIGTAMSEDVLRQRLDHISYGTSHLPGDMGKGIRLEPIERWKNVLTKNQEEIITSLTGRTAAKAGYPLGRVSSPGRGLCHIIHCIPSAKRKAIVFAKVLFLKAFDALI